MIKKDNNEEIFPVVDENGKTVGKATRGECHSGSKLLHPVVHLHLFDSSGRIYLQQRPLWKDIQPGKWDTAVGGHIDYGETVEAALRRETQEELGLTDLSVEFLLKYVFESERERELVHVFRATYDGDVRPSEELDGGRFWSLDELRESFGKGVLTPNFEQEYLKNIKYYCLVMSEKYIRNHFADIKKYAKVGPNSLKIRFLPEGRESFGKVAHQSECEFGEPISDVGILGKVELLKFNNAIIQSTLKFVKIFYKKI